MDDVLINFGGGIEIKSVGDGLWELRGPSVIFDAHEGGAADLAKEYFSADSYFGPGVVAGKTAEFEATFNHGIPTHEGLKALADYEFKNPVKTEVTDTGVIASLLLDEREDYEKMLAEFARKNPGKLGWSTATAAHRAKREKKTDGRTWIKRWPIVEIAVTHTPCEPRTAAAVSLKSLMDAAEPAKAVDGERLFTESLRQTEQQTWELWSAVQTGARKIVEAALAKDVTGVEVDVRQAVTALVGAYAPKLTEAIVSQITDYLGAEVRDEHFYLKSAFDSLNEDAPARFLDHLEVVLAAAREVNQRAKSIQELRVKSGRVLSEANRTRLASLLESLRASAGDIEALLAEAEPKPKEAKAADILSLLATFEHTSMRIDAAPLES